jgi:hypothetical protein
MLNKSNQNIIVESEKKNINLPIVVEDKIFQSWTLTKVRYDFTLIEKNIFVKIVELCQKYIDKKFLGQDCGIEVEYTIFGQTPTIQFPIRDIAAGNNYIQVRNSLDKMMNNAYGIPVDGLWDYHTVNLFEEAKSTKKRGLMSITLTNRFWKALNELSVYKILDPKVATKFRSVYTERFYELLIGNKSNVVFEVDHLKIMFCLEAKYKNNNDFIKRVVEPAAKEMKDMDICPIYFIYNPITGARRKIVKLSFHVMKKKDVSEKKEAREKLVKEVESVKLVDRVRKAVKESFPRLVVHEEVELKLKRAQYVFGVNGLCDIVTNLKQRIESLKKEGKVKTSMSAYFIGALDKMVEQYKSEEHERRTYHAPEQKPASIEVEEWSDTEYKYLTMKKVKHFADTVGMTVEDWTKKWEFERVDSNIWRVKKGL